ncbi:MAG TPA: phosphoenolpyruvate carboxylase, partial [Longimicrobium sp.]
MEPLWSTEDQAARLAELTGEDPALKEAPLRRDVRSLGLLLGRVIREQEGHALYSIVETLRTECIQLREQPEPDASLTQPASTAGWLVRDVGLDEAARVVKAFSLYFELINLAETAHRQRRRRAGQLHAGAEPQPGTFAGTLRRLREAGLGRDEVLALLARVTVIPVFTAHPTEVSRRTVLFKRARLAAALDRLDHLPLTRTEA